MSKEVEQLETERDALRRELIGVQEMLAFVLAQVGEPVVVTKETLQRGLPEKAQIAIDDNVEEEAFVFSLVVPE